MIRYNKIYNNSNNNNNNNKLHDAWVFIGDVSDDALELFRFNEIIIYYCRYF